MNEATITLNESIENYDLIVFIVAGAGGSGAESTYQKHSTVYPVDYIKNHIGYTSSWNAQTASYASVMQNGSTYVHFEFVFKNATQIVYRASSSNWGYGQLVAVYGIKL